MYMLSESMQSEFHLSKSLSLFSQNNFHKQFIKTFDLWIDSSLWTFLVMDYEGYSFCLETLICFVLASEHVSL